MSHVSPAGMRQVGWTLHGARMILESTSEEAIAYIRAHLGAGSDPAAPAGPDLRVGVEWRWGSMPAHVHSHRARSSQAGSAASRAAERAGRDLTDREGRLYWSRVPGFEGLTMDAGVRGGMVELCVHCGYVPRDSLARMRYLRTGRRAKKTHRTFFKLMYYAAYYPMIWHFERTRGWGLLHASAVERNGKAIVFSGLGGVGKSTLALSLLADPSFRFVSDNLVLHDSERIYALPEPVRLDPSSLMAIAAEGFAPARSEVPPTAHSKPTYWVEPSRVADSALADAVILLRFTPRSLIRPLSASETLAHLVAARDLVKEVEGYRSVAAFLSIAAARDQDDPVDPASLPALVRKGRAYLLGIGEGEPVRTTLARIREICA